MEPRVPQVSGEIAVAAGFQEPQYRGDGRTRTGRSAAEPAPLVITPQFSAIRHARPISWSAKSQTEPIAVMPEPLLDDLVGGGERRWRHFEASVLVAFKVAVLRLMNKC